MTLPFEQTDAAFRFLLGRAANPAARFETRAELHNAILESAEFKASPQARKYFGDWPFAANFVSHKAKAIYCPIGKVGCTFMKRQFARIEGLPYLDGVLADIHTLSERVNTGLIMADYPEVEARALAADPDYFRFAVIRNPFDRLLSAYLEKFVQNRHNNFSNSFHASKVVRPVQMARGFSEVDYDTGISFRDFITFITRQPRGTLDPHWNEQVDYFRDLELDTIVELDRVNDMVAVLEARSGQTLPRARENVTDHEAGETYLPAADLLPGEIEQIRGLHPASFWDEALTEAVYGYFARDVDLLEQIRAEKP